MRVPRLRLAALTLAAMMTFSPAAALAQTVSASPNLTVVGFGVVNLAPSLSAAQLELSFQTSAPTAAEALRMLEADLSRSQRELVAVGVGRSAVAMQGSPGLNFVSAASHKSCETVSKLKHVALRCPSQSWMANASLQVTLPNLAETARVVDKTRIVRGPGVNGFYINQGNPTGNTATNAALQAGYSSALANARQAALQLARADHLVLGGEVAVSEGTTVSSSSSSCGAMGCGSAITEGVNPPVVGQNQELVAVTVTYSTRP